MKQHIVLGFLLVGSLVAQAQTSSTTAKKSTTKEMPAISAEQRQKMAAAHQQMADCLKSDKSMQECHDMMMKSGMMDKGGCMMMENGHGKGHAMGHMMKHESESSESTSHDHE